MIDLSNLQQHRLDMLRELFPYNMKSLMAISDAVKDDPNYEKNFDVSFVLGSFGDGPLYLIVRPIAVAGLSIEDINVTRHTHMCESSVINSSLIAPTKPQLRSLYEHVKKEKENVFIFDEIENLPDWIE